MDSLDLTEHDVPKDIKRGITVMKKVIKAKGRGERFEIEWNEYGQPVGPNHDIFESYIGVIVRARVPITFSNWKKVPEHYKDDIWVEVTVNCHYMILYCSLLKQ